MSQIGFKEVVASGTADVVGASGEAGAGNNIAALSRIFGGLNGGDILRHAAQEAAQGGGVGGADQQLLGDELGHSDLVGKLLSGATPSGVCCVFGRQVAEDLENDVATGETTVERGGDVGHGFGLGGSAGAVTHDVVHQAGGEVAVAEEIGVAGRESFFSGVDVDDLLGAQASVVGCVQLIHVDGAGSGTESDDKELISICLLLGGHWHGLLRGLKITNMRSAGNGGLPRQL